MSLTGMCLIIQFFKLIVSVLPDPDFFFKLISGRIQPDFDPKYFKFYVVSFKNKLLKSKYHIFKKIPLISKKCYIFLNTLLKKHNVIV